MPLVHIGSLLNYKCVVTSANNNTSQNGPIMFQATLNNKDNTIVNHSILVTSYVALAVSSGEQMKTWAVLIFAHAEKAACIAYTASTSRSVLLKGGAMLGISPGGSAT